MDAVDTHIVFISDTHTASTTALFPNFRFQDGKWHSLTSLGGWPFKHNPNYYPTSQQLQIWNHFVASLEREREARHGKRLVIVFLGDSHDGVHHGTKQLATFIVGEQIEAHVQLMRLAKLALGFTEGDRLLYLSGTESHVADDEEQIAMMLDAERYTSSRQVADFLELEVNGVLIWAYHHGVSAGVSPSRGNGLRNALKRIYFQCLETGRRQPDLVVTAHTHDPIKVTYDGEWKQIHGMILPSWQNKTRFALAKVPLSLNRIGLWGIDITENGTLLPIQKPFLMESPFGDVLKI